MDEIERIAQEIRNLTCDLTASDYKVIKCYEYSLIGQELPYNVQEINVERQAIRDRINYLQEQIKETEG